jgi:subfamily B ATP-binding cassette protein MsbA
LLTLLGLFAAMIYLDWLLSLVALVILPIAIVPITRIGKRLRRVSRSRQEHTGLMAGLAAETFGAARIVKAYGLERYLEVRACAAFEGIRKLNVKAATQRGRIEPIMEAIAGTAVAAILLLIGWRILDGQQTIGEFSGFLGALLLAAQPLRSLSNLNAVIQEGIAALERYFDVLDEAPTILERPGARAVEVTRGEVRFDSVRFAYAEQSPALHDVGFTAEAGRTTAFVGRSGAGKSTIFNLIPRLYDVSGGAIRIDGIDIRDMTLASLRGAIAVVSQDVVLFNDTVAVNIGLGREGASREEIEAAARLAAAHDFIMRLPDGYDTIVGDRGLRLSGGERQRISLARAFLKDAPILLLDEATSALDSESEKLVQAALGRLAKGRTTLVIAHRLSTVMHADQILVLDQGLIVERGRHQQLLDQRGHYARMWQLQQQRSDTSPAQSGSSPGLSI